MSTSPREGIRHSIKKVRCRLPGLPEGMCTKSLLKFIGSITGLVAKIDWNTDNSCKGQFARLVVYMELGKSFVSKIITDGKLQRVEYESLPKVCLDCGRFGHSQEECPHKSSQETTLEGKEKSRGVEPRL
ncbi:hypothetical protein Gogos_009344 [Gossypium gossypioides]|uniref:CCHC-type domain-containing protein n=1 Tax=Gossypium gossypioides TaxID=34282 RepID=A0A7J9CEB4_GOSGO|nr:hypothetical protein [Gossypium gossypioides]